MGILTPLTQSREFASMSARGYAGVLMSCPCVLGGRREPIYPTVGLSSLLFPWTSPPGTGQALNVAIQTFLLKPFLLLPLPSPYARNTHFYWQGLDTLPMNLCPKRKRKKCKRQVLPAGQARGCCGDQEVKLPWLVSCLSQQGHRNAAGGWQKEGPSES